MIKNVILTIICSLFIYVNSFSQTYFEKYQPIADSLESVYGIPSAIMLAIAYHESGGGKSEVAKHSNNHFGIKGTNKKVNSKFRYYESDTASYIGFCNVISNKKFYSKLRGCTDVGKWVNSISACGYAGNSTTWPKKVLSIIRTKNLS